MSLHTGADNARATILNSGDLNVSTSPLTIGINAPSPKAFDTTGTWYATIWDNSAYPDSPGMDPLMEECEATYDAVHQQVTLTRANPVDHPGVVTIGNLNGWRYVSELQSAIGSGAVLPVVIGLHLASNVTTPNSKVDYAARAAILLDSSYNAKIFRTVSGTIDATTNGADGLDTGSQTADTLYYLWLVGKSDGTIKGLLSTSATAPTLPSGYTFSRLLSWVVSDHTNHFIPFTQDDDYYLYSSRYTVYDVNPATTGSDVTINLNTANTYPLIGTALCRKVSLSVQGGGGSAQSISFFSAALSNALEWYWSVPSGNMSLTGWCGCDPSAQIKYRYVSGGDRLLVAVQGAKVDWF